MAAPQRNAKPAVPAVLAILEVDAHAKDLKKHLARFAKELEAKLAEYQVKEYVVARGEKDGKLQLHIIPCASSPELRTGEAPEAESSTSAKAIGDALERAALGPNTSERKGPATAKGIAPKKGGGFGLRKR